MDQKCFRIGKSKNELELLGRQLKLSIINQKYNL